MVLRSVASTAIIVLIGLVFVRPAGADISADLGSDGSLHLTPERHKRLCERMKNCEDLVRAECNKSNPNGWMARRFCKQYCTSQEEVDRIKERIGCSVE